MGAEVRGDVKEAHAAPTGAGRAPGGDWYHLKYKIGMLLLEFLSCVHGEQSLQLRRDVKLYGIHHFGARSVDIARFEASWTEHVS